MLDLLILGAGISHVVIVSNGKYDRNGNDPEFFSISIMVNVPEVREPEISGTLFYNSGTFRKILVYGKIVPEFSEKRFRKNVRNILNSCKR